MHKLFLSHSQDSKFRLKGHPGLVPFSYPLDWHCPIARTSTTEYEEKGSLSGPLAKTQTMSGFKDQHQHHRIHWGSIYLILLWDAGDEIPWVALVLHLSVSKSVRHKWVEWVWGAAWYQSNRSEKRPERRGWSGVFQKLSALTWICTHWPLWENCPGVRPMVRELLPTLSRHDPAESSFAFGGVKHQPRWIIQGLGLEWRAEL